MIELSAALWLLENIAWLAPAKALESSGSFLEWSATHDKAVQHQEAALLKAWTDGISILTRTDEDADAPSTPLGDANVLSVNRTPSQLSRALSLLEIATGLMNADSNLAGLSSVPDLLGDITLGIRQRISVGGIAYNIRTDKKTSKRLKRCMLKALALSLARLPTATSVITHERGAFVPYLLEMAVSARDTHEDRENISAVLRQLTRHPSVAKSVLDTYPSVLESLLRMVSAHTSDSLSSTPLAGPAERSLANVMATLHNMSRAPGSLPVFLENQVFDTLVAYLRPYAARASAYSGPAEDKASSVLYCSAVLKVFSNDPTVQSMLFDNGLLEYLGVRYRVVGTRRR
ncbi:hypothetical protein KIPB_010027 [Kipferlia bialata]|uniref:Uncharacterized protein n=1 Tax=Kipferlia bialata TaxID=797122 RepID=A0A9K3D4Q5_9EUKA|nr:hypothetical protein KIPB_010027 [Kipferlia bialata]|eukprot:g10027.t1